LNLKCDTIYRRFPSLCFYKCNLCRYSVVLLETYPSRTAPLMELGADAGLLPFGRYELAMNMVEGLYGDTPAEVMVFGFVEWLRGMLRQWREEDTAVAGGAGGGGGGGGTHASNADDAGDEEEDGDGDGDGEKLVWDPNALEEELAALALAQSETDYDEERRTRGDGAAVLSMEEDVAASIVHGVPFTVMKSTFQAHLCAGLTSVEQVDVMMAVLRLNSKVARATHNMMAYRIHQPNGSWAMDHDEDGENAAVGLYKLNAVDT
jgi:hypothetical protein